jgi:hypothetical protein
MQQLRPTQWIVQCAQQLQERWHSVDHAQLEEVAVDIWKDERLRVLEPAEAATAWLAPIAGERQ